MMRWFTSDLHFSHQNIIEYEPKARGHFANVDEMNAAIVERFNEEVAVDDEVYVLGDVALGKIDESLRWVGWLHGDKHLIVGNHDRCFLSPYHKVKKREKAKAARSLYLEAGFLSVKSFDQIRIGDELVSLSHFPYRGDYTEEDRFAWARPIDQGNWLLCGHVHSAWRQRGRQVNVGVDAWALRPVSELKVIDLLSSPPQNLESL